MSARLGALCHQHGGPGVQGSQRMLGCMDLADQRHPGRMDAWGEGRRVGKRQHDRGRLMSQRDVEQRRILRHGPCNEAAAYSLIARLGEFMVQPGAVAVATA